MPGGGVRGKGGRSLEERSFKKETGGNIWLREKGGGEVKGGTVALPFGEIIAVAWALQETREYIKTLLVW